MTVLLTSNGSEGPPVHETLLWRSREEEEGEGSLSLSPSARFGGRGTELAG
jgi:hypothetical protein